MLKSAPVEWELDIRSIIGICSIDWNFLSLSISWTTKSQFHLIQANKIYPITYLLIDPINIY